MLFNGLPHSRGFTHLMSILRFYYLDAHIRWAVAPLLKVHMTPPYFSVFTRSARFGGRLGHLMRNHVGFRKYGPLAAHLP